MRIFAFTTVLMLVTATAGAQNLVRDYVRARSYGDTHSMNGITAYARNPYSSLQRPYSPSINVRVYPRYTGPRAFNYGNRRYAVTQPLSTSLDRPVRVQYRTVPRSYGGVTIYEEVPINIYYPGGR